MRDSDNSVRIKGQTTVSQSEDHYDENGQRIDWRGIGIGRPSLGGEYTDGDCGQVAEATATYDVSSMTGLTYKPHPS
ncbi:hypothetical protein O9993_16575 [Vibrio lentus]|nr:hypothetical protein [Vibrio lentus]